ncbi:hypothetical protein EMGBS12_03630 [Methylophilaceae bacterium]|nr:hypothetical protein EMGBS12_03630 [Methylophilaceae bacterium]
MLFGSRKLAKSRSFSSFESLDAEGPAGFDTSTIGVELQPIKNSESNEQEIVTFHFPNLQLS